MISVRPSAPSSLRLVRARVDGPAPGFIQKRAIMDRRASFDYDKLAFFGVTLIQGMRLPDMGNQDKNMSAHTDHGDPQTWDPKLDAVSVAPENHVVLHEDDFIRVLSVRLPAGETEKPHHHRFPPVLIIDRGIKAQDFDGVTHQEIGRSSPNQGQPLLPVVVRLPPQALHYIENQDTKAFHGIRIEFKKGFPIERGSTAGPSYGYPDGSVR